MQYRFALIHFHKQMFLKFNSSMFESFYICRKILNMQAQSHTPNFWDKLIPDMETNRFGTISIIILLIGCLGGITVSQGAGQSWIQLSILVAPMMTTLVLLLAVMPMRLILNATLITLVIDVVVLLYNIFS
jgi:CBS-domain-containing membrane protein